MTKVNYLKDTKRFWQTREKARKNLDTKRTSASYSEKVTIADKLRSDARFLKSGRIISSKSSPKPPKT